MVCSDIAFVHNKTILKQTKCSGISRYIGDVLNDVIWSKDYPESPLTKIMSKDTWIAVNYNMTVWILAGNYISFTIAAGLIRLHMPGVKKSRV